MKRTLTAVVVALDLVAATAAPAFAECAWVLWKQERINIPPRPISVEWSIPIAFVDRTACVAWIERNAKEWEKTTTPGQSVMRAPTGTAAEFRTEGTGGRGSGITNTILCVPDTVDPRGPKGNRG